MKFFEKLCSFFSLCCGGAPPFTYDLHLLTIPGTNSRTMVCFHGYGANFHLAVDLKSLQVTDSTLVGFNFPDHDLQEKTTAPQELKFGTIQELLPAVYVLKKLVIDQGLTAVDLYGFSAGGAAVINTIAILNTSTYDAGMKKIGISSKEKEKILGAIQNGIVILDAPLKSTEEIIDLRGSSTELEIIAESYRKNHLRPIDSLKSLKGLSLDVILYFEEFDEIIFNRDDVLFIERLKKANCRGTTSVVIENDGGHLAPHMALWQFYSDKLKKAAD